MTTKKHLLKKELHAIYDYLPSRGTFNTSAMQAILLQVRPEATPGQLKNIYQPLTRLNLIERAGLNRYRKVMPSAETLFSPKSVAEKKAAFKLELDRIAPNAEEINTDTALAEAIKLIIRAGGLVVFGETKK